MHELESKPWMRAALWAAAAYNIVWGTLAIAAPSAMFHWAGMTAPNYPELWQCIGMIVGVYGLGYAIAGFDPYRHWPIVLVGFLGKLFGPIGFLDAALHGRLPWAFGWNNVTNDLIWLIPFALILRGAHAFYLEGKITTSGEIQAMALRATTQEGQSVQQMSNEAPVLLVFLRHAGCTFCREALYDLSANRSAIEAQGTKLVLVHMGVDAESEPFFSRYGLEDLPRISDPRRSLYRAFGLTRGTLNALFGPKVWLRGFQVGILDGHGIGGLVGDGFQMPGVFLIYHGEVIRSYRHQSVTDRPDYLHFAADGNTTRLAG